jgi:DNA-binding GntR family transcriptional regulator
MGVLRETISSHLGETLQKQKDTAQTMSVLAREHAAILEAVAAGRSKRARALMEAHIHDFYLARDRREQKPRAVVRDT